jgi:hypothetical protein
VDDRRRQCPDIGWYSGRRILALERFSTENTEGFTGGTDEEIKRRTAKFFAMHYGIFHLVYLLFMLSFVGAGKLPGGLQVAPITGNDVAWIAVASLIFVLTHRASFRRNIEHDRHGRPNIGALMFLPYARVLPMHLAIILGLILGHAGAILLFGILKTIADVGMHWVEHRVLAANPETEATER